MDIKKKTVGKMDLGASSGAEGWRDVLQLLKEQNEKMEKLARALSVIQKGMLRNNPGFVKDSVNEAAEVLGGMLNTHRCLLESGVELQKRLETHPASKKMGVGERAEISALVSTRSLEIRDLDETVEKEEVVSALCLALDRPAFEGCCRLFTRFGRVKTAVIRLAEADAARLLQLGKLRIGWKWKWKSPAAAGALGMATGPGAATTPTEKTSVGDVAERDIWPGVVRRHQGA